MTTRIDEVQTIADSARAETTQRAVDHAYYTAVPNPTDLGINTILVAFCITGAEREQAERLLHDRLPKGDAPLTSDDDGPYLDSWWVAEDTRYDRSDCDSAIFVPKGKQAAVGELLWKDGVFQHHVLPYPMAKPAETPNPWAFQQFHMTITEGDGNAIDVNVDGFGLVQIEQWDVPGAGGVDVYAIDDNGNRGREVSTDLVELLGEDKYEYLTGDWFARVQTTFWQTMDDNGYATLLAKATEAVAGLA